MSSLSFLSKELVFGVCIGFAASYFLFQRNNRLFSKKKKKGGKGGKKAAVSGPYKLVMCVRQDLKMGKGKIAAQCCHAAVACVQQANECDLNQWERYGTAKIALKAKDEETLSLVAAAARDLGLNYYVVCDAGRTQIAAGSRTVCGIGPAPVSEIDKITGRSGICPLKLM